jgi:tRNA A37 methylthiotransferase MiaB
MHEDVIPVFLITDDPDHIPLAMGMVVAYCKQYGEGRLDRKYRFLPTVDLSVSEVLKIGQAFGPGVWLFSNYVWTTARCLEVCRRIKAVDERNVTIHGGPNAPKYEKAAEEFLKAHRHVDFLVRGEGEITSAELLDHIAEQWASGDIWNQDLEAIQGISFIEPNQSKVSVTRTADRPRLLDLDGLPSPYLSGVFDRGFIRTGGDGSPNTRTGATIETNRGCPYKCTFCDWGSLTNQKISHFSIERVEQEIEWVGRNKIPVLVIADANFGIFERDIEIARIAARVNKEFGYPKEFQVSYAKNDSKRRTEIVKVLFNAGLSSQGIVSIQTRDATALAAVDRSNIKSDQYDSLTGLFQKEKLPLAAELMIGLPGSTLKSFKNDLQFYFDGNVLVRANLTRLLMNSPMAAPEYMAQHKIRTAGDSDLVVSTASFSRDDYEVMVKIYYFYRLFVRYSVLTYVIRYLQWEHGVSAIDFLHEAVIDSPGSLPIVSKAIDVINEPKYPRSMVNHMFYHSEEVYGELIEYICRKYGFTDTDSAFSAVVAANKAVIPCANRNYPFQVHLPHDFPRYFLDGMANNGEPGKKLTDYGDCMFEVADPHEISETIEAGAYFRFNPYQTYFELESTLSAHNMTPHWISLKRPSY